MTSDKKWTGGEWSADTETYSDAAMIYGGDGYLIADMVEVLSHKRGGSIHDKDARDIDHEEVVANSHLMTNAKRLYEALELALTRMAHKHDCMVCLPSDQWAERGSWAADNCQCEIAIVKAALAAARGEKKK